MARKLIGTLYQTGIPGPRGKDGPAGPQGPAGEYFIPDNVLSIERLGDYTYKISFNNIPDYIPSNNILTGGCTSFVRNGKLYRNFDYNYDNTATFWVKCKDFEGIASITGLNDGELNTELLGQLPYHLADGRNNDGLRVSEHILFNDFDFEGSGDRSNPIQLLPYVLLSKQYTMENIQEWLDNVSIPDALSSQEYLLQFLVYDGETSYCITPSSTGYEVIDISSNPKLTNFKWVDKAIIINRNDEDLQDRPTGIERWNLIESDATLEDLKFTLAYEYPDRLSEFIGIDDTTKESTDAQLIHIYNRAHTAYINRTRNGYTWQTVHSVVYGSNGLEALSTQENYNNDYSDINKNEVVVSWNSRQGEVTPEYGDYTLNMVGAEMLTNTEIDELWSVN